jgi:hypothetical protein
VDVKSRLTLKDRSAMTCTFLNFVRADVVIEPGIGLVELCLSIRQSELHLTTRLMSDCVFWRAGYVFFNSNRLYAESCVDAS